MNILIDNHGDIWWDNCAEDIDLCVWKLGQIYIKKVDAVSAAVWIAPRIVTQQALNAAFLMISWGCKSIHIRADPMIQDGEECVDSLTGCEKIRQMVAGATSLTRSVA